MKASELTLLERSFKTTTESMLQKNLCTYLNGLKENKINKLLQESTDSFVQEERNITIGELRIIKKLLDILEPKVEVI